MTSKTGGGGGGEGGGQLSQQNASLLRWSETKNLKISNLDNIFFLYLIMIKLCTIEHLKNIHQKLKLKSS